MRLKAATLVRYFVFDNNVKGLSEVFNVICWYGTNCCEIHSNSANKVVLNIQLYDSLVRFFFPDVFNILYDAFFPTFNTSMSLFLIIFFQHTVLWRFFYKPHSFYMIFFNIVYYVVSLKLRHYTMFVFFRFCRHTMLCLYYLYLFWYAIVWR